jgi:hypothetical protein
MKVYLMPNLKIILSAVYITLCLFLQSCGGEKTIDEASEEARKVARTTIPDNNTLGEIVDQDPSPNQVRDSILVNDVAVGITVYVTDNTGQVTFEMLDSAQGRFSVDETSGTVYVLDYLLLNANLFSSHTIKIQAASSNGLKNSK